MHYGLPHLRQPVSLIEVYPICLSCEPSCWCCRRWARFSPPALPRRRLLLPLRPTRRDRRGRADAGACLSASLPQRHGDCAVPVLGGAQAHCSPAVPEKSLVIRHLPALCPHRAHLHLPRAFPKGRMESPFRTPPRSRSTIFRCAERLRVDKSPPIAYDSH